MEKSKTNRQVWIDNARAFAMIAVVWMHTVNVGLKDGILPSGMVMSFNMPLFVFISGYCAYHSLERIHQMADLWHYIKKLVMCIGIPNICYWAADYWIANVFQQNITKSIATAIFLVLIISYGYLGRAGGGKSSRYYSLPFMCNSFDRFKSVDGKHF